MADIRSGSPALNDTTPVPGAPEYRPNAAFRRALLDKAKLDRKMWGRG